MGIETAIIGSALLGTYGANKQAKAATNAAQTQYQQRIKRNAAAFDSFVSSRPTQQF
jgi:hypothetical protein